jgi:hypothetical protein
MVLVELAVVVVAFAAMAIVFRVQERAERRRIVARAEAVLAREGSFEAPAADELARRDLRLVG